MPDKVRIAIDAMGGDHGASVLLPGADISLTRHPDIEYLLFGDRAVVEPLLDGLPRLKAKSKLIHTEVSIRMDDKPSQALRYGRWKSSMWLAIDAVKKGEADVAVSAGNTGALMAMARFNLKMIEGIERPAIAGAVADAQGRIGRARCRRLDRRRRRRIWSTSPSWAAPWRACCSMSSGRPSACSISASRRSRASSRCARPAASCARANLPHFDYHGFVEGDDIGKGTVDVVVTEGFAGNIALKTAEGTARQFAPISARRHEPHLGARGSAICWRARRSRRCATRWIRAKSNGGVFLGLNGIVIKSHGGTDAEGFAAAVDMGYDMVRYELLAKIGQSHGARSRGRRQRRSWRAEPPRDPVAFRRARLRQLSAGAHSHQ